MTIANLPEDPQMFEYKLTPVFNTVISEFGDKYSGQNEQARSLGEFATYDMKIKVRQEMCDKAQMQGLWNHYLAAKGRAERFYYFDYLVAMTHTGRLCGVGDGSQTLFEIPGRSTSAQSVYAAGVAVSVSQYNYATGVAGNDQAVLAAAPAEGEVVTADFYGYGCFYGRYDKDKMDRDTFYDFLFGFNLKIKGLPWPV